MHEALPMRVIERVGELHSVAHHVRGRQVTADEPIGESAIEGLDARAQADLPSPRITFAGRLAADKGADVLVEAIGMLADPPPTYLLGDGDYSARWAIISDDGHLESGVIAFGVGSCMM